MLAADRLRRERQEGLRPVRGTFQNRFFGKNFRCSERDDSENCQWQLSGSVHPQTRLDTSTLFPRCAEAPLNGDFVRRRGGCREKAKDVVIIRPGPEWGRDYSRSM